ncbi:hypothetical protein QUA30_18695 [Microcoleus sp. Pol14C2]
MLRNCWKAKEGSSATDFLTDVTDVTDGKKKEEETSHLLINTEMLHHSQ